MKALQKLGVKYIYATAAVGLGGGLACALGAGQAVFAAGFAAGGAGTMSVGLVAGIGSLAIIVSGFLQ
jgi:energy-coupling factor transport system substrate-specific component